MNFPTPTTKAEMYATLKSIYTYYRIRFQGFDLPTLNHVLSIDTIQFTPLTDAQLIAKAEDFIEGEKIREVKEMQMKLGEEIAVLSAEILCAENSLSDKIASISDKYEKELNKIKLDAKSKGIIRSDVVINKIKEIEYEKAKEIAKITSETNEQITKLNAKKTFKETALSGATTYFDDIYQSKIDEKFYRLKEEQTKLKKEIDRYNNIVSEKIQKHAVSVSMAEIEYQLKFIEIQTAGFSKEQLVDMGYYKDVVDCVKGYYFTLSAQAAYNDIKNESDLVFYLDDFYSTVVFYFQARI